MLPGAGPGLRRFVEEIGEGAGALGKDPRSIVSSASGLAVVSLCRFFMVHNFLYTSLSAI